MPRILIIDDDLEVLAALSTIISAHGYVVITTPDGREALRIHQSTPVDVVITDILMPQIDGIELIRALRDRDPNVKLIAISGGGWAEPDQFLTMATRFGANATFSKPLPWNSLLETLAALSAKTT